MAADQLTQDYEKLLDFICRSENFEDISELYQALDEFWQDEYQSLPMLVYSIPKDRESLDSEELQTVCRSFWKSKKSETFYTSEEVDFLLQKIKDDFNDESTWKEYHLGNNYFYIIHCGSIPNQDFYGIFKTDNNIHETILNYLGKFLSNTSLKMQKYNEATKLKSLVHVDDVTGLYNQRKFLNDIDERIKKFEESGETFSVIFIDIDHFKQVNDGHGHLVGTQLLSDVAEIFREVLRENDMIYRYGGDEFVIIIPNISNDDVKNLSDRILKTISKKTFSVDEEKGMQGSQEFKMTVSIGIAVYPEHAKSRNEIIAIADKMMYEAKQAGRGRVRLANDFFNKED